MNVFDLRQRLIEDYAEYTRSFLDIADPRIRGLVGDGLLWPHPRLTPPGARSFRTRRGADSGRDICAIVGGRSL